MPYAWNCDYTPNALDGRSIKDGEERRELESRQSPGGDAQFNLNAYYLFSHIMLGQAGGQFLFSKGFKSRYTVSLMVNTKWIPKALNPQRKIPSVFQDSDNGDCSCTHEFKEYGLCTLKTEWQLMKAVKATNYWPYKFPLYIFPKLSLNRMAAMSVAKRITKVPKAKRYQV